MSLWLCYLCLMRYKLISTGEFKLLAPKISVAREMPWMLGDSKPWYFRWVPDSFIQLVSVLCNSNRKEN